MSGPEEPAASTRLSSLDAFRGFAMVTMVIVNNPGDWGTVYWPLLHAEWHGWTPTDLIFPFFLFIVGVAMPFSRRTSLLEAAKRSAILIGLGLFMAAYPYFDIVHLRWPGVLQRIGLVYFLAFAIKRFVGPRGRGILTVAILLGYWALMTLVPIPGGQAPNLEPGTNLAAWVDRAVMGGHLWKSTGTWDPEGLLSSLPALATVLLGLFAGERLRSGRPRPALVRDLAGSGVVLTAAGLAWGRLFPINKGIWTSSYVVFTAGASLLLFAILFNEIDVRGHRAWARPLVVCGRNAIVLFVGSGILVRTMLWWGVKQPLYDALFRSWLPPYPASLAFAIANVLFWYAILWELDRRKIYLHV